MPFGDYVYWQNYYTRKITDVVLATGDAGKDNVITPKTSNHQLYIQKIMVNPVTAAAQAITFQDDAGTPVKIATVPASQSTPIVFDFGPKGYALTLGKNLDISNTAGPAMSIHIEAYERLGATIDVSLGASSQ